MVPGAKGAQQVRRGWGQVGGRDGCWVADAALVYLDYRTKLGRLLSNFQPGKKNCIAAASSRLPRPMFR